MIIICLHWVVWFQVIDDNNSQKSIIYTSNYFLLKIYWFKKFTVFIDLKSLQFYWFKKFTVFIDLKSLQLLLI